MEDRVFSVEIRAPVQAVWDEITKLGTVQVPMMNTVLETDFTPGSRLRYYSPDRKYVLVIGEVVECSPPHKFAHTYVMTDLGEAPTLVTWELHEIPNGVRVTVTHSQFSAKSAKTHKRVKGGWAFILENLKVLMEQGDVPFKTKFQYGLFGMMMWMLPKRSRADNVETLEKGP